MPDDWITISTAKVLERMLKRLDHLHLELDRVLEVLASDLRPSATTGLTANQNEDRPEVDWRGKLTQVETDLLKMRCDLAGALDAASFLDAVPRRSTDGRNHAACEDSGGTAVDSTNDDQTIALAGMSPTSVHRMSEIAHSLKLTHPQTLERCIATQFYVDSRLRERWQFFMKRGRERRAVSFPGQSTV